jgi:hypothetical protein
LTDTFDWCCQLVASLQARRNTHSPSASIKPFSSATGMKIDGGMLPRTGCFQRSSAS